MPGLKAPQIDPFGQRLAVNLWDVERIGEQLLAAIRSRLDLQREAVVSVDDEKDGDGRFVNTAIPFNCPLLAAATLLDVVRSTDRRVGDVPTRAYLFRDGWRRLTRYHVLTVVDGDKVSLNPAVFRVDMPLAAGVQPAAVKLF